MNSVNEPAVLGDGSECRSALPNVVSLLKKRHFAPEAIVILLDAIRPMVVRAIAETLTGQYASVKFSVLMRDMRDDGHPQSLETGYTPEPHRVIYDSINQMRLCFETESHEIASSLLFGHSGSADPEKVNEEIEIIMGRCQTDFLPASLDLLAQRKSTSYSRSPTVELMIFIREGRMTGKSIVENEGFLR